MDLFKLIIETPADAMFFGLLCLVLGFLIATIGTYVLLFFEYYSL